MKNLLGALLRFLHQLVGPVANGDQNTTPRFSGEDLHRFLPTFLSQGSQTEFLEEIRYFLTKDGMQYKRFYTSTLAKQAVLFQGDGLGELEIIRLPDPTRKSGRALLVSNTCDMDTSNARLFDASLTYAPIISLPRYLNALRGRFPAERVAQHEQDIRQQLITQMFFLPRGGKLEEDSVVLLDRMISSSTTSIDRATVPDIRLFTLSDFGAWLLALKLSIHFCRIRDRVDRHAGIIA